jgi:ABC-type cobalt transport system substrate-binding protein
MTIPIYVFLIAITWPSNIFAADSGKSQETVLWSIVLIVLSGVIGYFVGAIKSFREEKQSNKVNGVKSS